MGQPGPHWPVASYDERKKGRKEGRKKERKKDSTIKSM